MSEDLELDQGQGVNKRKKSLLLLVLHFLLIVAAAVADVAKLKAADALEGLLLV